MSYRDHRYTDKLDFQAFTDAYAGPGMDRRIKAGLHIAEYGTGVLVGDPDAAPPLKVIALGGDGLPDATNLSDADAIEAFDEKVAQADDVTEAELTTGGEGQPAAVIGEIGAALAAWKALKFLRDNAPEIYAAARALLLRVMKDRR